MTKEKIKMQGLRVFISYDSKDEAFAKKIYDDLNKAGVIPWMTYENLLPGQNWKMEVRRAIRESEFIVVLLSPNSISKRSSVQKELDLSLKILSEFPSNEIFLIPVRLEECYPDHKELQEIHAIDLFPSYEDGLSKILRVLGVSEVASIHSKVIKILFFAANPFDDNIQLKLDEEIRAIDKALIQSEFREQFELLQVRASRITDLQQSMVRQEPDIVHFTSHGSKYSEIVLEDNSGNIQPLSHLELSELFSVLKGKLKCVILDNCYSRDVADLILGHIRYVILRQGTTNDESAISFFSTFYIALGEGKDIEAAFNFASEQIKGNNKPVLIF
ncbi:MAG: TIR domain-containing protein [Desulfobacteraceae bacterium]|nr:TIR domain-containing protein [Desulfobacteraceae bacterium]